MKILIKLFLLISLSLYLLFFSLNVFASGGNDEKMIIEDVTSDDGVMGFLGEHDANWKLEATDPLLIGGYGDNFNYDGSNTKLLSGTAVVNVNAETNTGIIEVVFEGTINPEANVTYTGEIKIVFDKFAEDAPFWEGGIADFVYLHGATKQGPPVMPKVITYLASWGMADVYVNGELVYENLDGHMMYTERSRDVDTFAIYNSDMTGFFSPADPGNSSIADPDEREIHFVVHDTTSDTDNFPPNAIWIHLNFTNVKEVN